MKGPRRWHVPCSRAATMHDHRPSPTLARRAGIPLLSAALLSAIVLACGRPDGREVVNRSAPAVCEKAKECNGGKFDKAYPGGVDECTQSVKAEIEKQRGGDLDKQSVCTDDEVTKCLEDLKASECPAPSALSNLQLPQVPCDC